MDGLREIAEFSDHLHDADTPEKLSELVGRYARNIGFRHFAIAHHVDHRVLRGKTALIHNYPKDWADHFREQGLYTIDPVFQASEQTSIGFSWSGISGLMNVTERQQRMLRDAARYGIVDGFSIPVHVPGEPSGSCTFVSPIDGILTREMTLHAQLAGALAFERARKIVIERSGPLGARVVLTERQRECVILAARGMTDSEIAGRLGIGIETVKMHLRTVRDRYGVSKRMTLAVRALNDGQISFSEVLNALPLFGEWANQSDPR